MSCHTFPDRDPALKPRPATEHMPFIGHRNCAQWGGRSGFHAAGDYGLDPEFAKVARR
jgi:hypothetical protein